MQFGWGDPATAGADEDQEAQFGGDKGAMGDNIYETQEAHFGGEDLAAYYIGENQRVQLGGEDLAAKSAEEDQEAHLAGEDCTDRVVKTCARALETPERSAPGGMDGWTNRTLKTPKSGNVKEIKRPLV